jgi:hypothetical protein
MHCSGASRWRRWCSRARVSRVENYMSMVGLCMSFGQTDSLSRRSIDSNRFPNVDIIEACMEASRDGEVDIPPSSPSYSVQCLPSIPFYVRSISGSRCAISQPFLPLPCCWFRQWLAVFHPLILPRSSATRNLDLAMSNLWTEL